MKRFQTQHCCAATPSRAATALATGLALLMMCASTNAALVTSATSTYLSLRDCTKLNSIPNAIGNNFGPATCGTVFAAPSVSGDASAADPDFDNIVNIRTGDFLDFNISGPSGSADYQTADGVDGTYSLGSARASAAFSDEVGAPILKAEAISTVDGRVGASAAAIQRFDNTGDTAITTTFGGLLTFDITGNPSVVGGLETLVQITINLFTTPTGFIEVAEPGSRASVFSLNANEDVITNTWGGTYLAESFSSAQYLTAPGVGSPILTNEITIGAGESLFVNTYLNVFASAGATTDAFSTLETGFFDVERNQLGEVLSAQIFDPTDPSSINPLSSLVAVQESRTVPVPPSSVLLVLGLLLLKLRRRVAAVSRTSTLAL
jgi:hypothetical protein